MMEAVPERFHMILDETNPEYENLPGIWVLVGGLWVANLYYWGFNQYIIQRTLAAKSLKEAQKGIVLAACLKLVIPFIVVIPGIAAFVMIDSPAILERLGTEAMNNVPQKSDEAYPWLLQLLPDGLKGIAFAALAAAIVSSLASMLNSTSTIFTMDIYKQYIDKNASDKKTVNVGRISAAVALLIACIMAPLLGGIDQAFQYIQEYTGIVSPGILGVFLLGLFWKKTTNKGAIWGAILSVPIALLFKLFPKIPFMNQMGLTCLITMLVIIVVSHLEGRGKDSEKGIEIRTELFKTSPSFNIGAFAVMIVVSVLYALFW
jgi:SSS family solute:Na+ symporter